MILLRSSPSKGGTVSVIIYVNQVTLSWTMPSDDASMIIDYTLQDPTDDYTWNVSTDEIHTNTSSTISSLSNNTTYYFAVVLSQFPRCLNLS